MNCHSDLLPESQRTLWARFEGGSWRRWVLYGGTALALRLGHRCSIDFDFFSAGHLTREVVHESFPWLNEAEVQVLQQEPDTYVILGRDQGMPSEVKLAFFGGLTFGQIEPPECAPNGVRIASLRDLFATKLAALHNRIACKDYRDIAALLRVPIPLADGIACLQAIHPSASPAVIARALCHFEGGDLAALPQDDRRTIETAVAALGDLPEPPPTRPIGSPG